MDFGHLISSVFQFSAEEAVEYQLESLKYNDQPRHDYGIEVMYRVKSLTQGVQGVNETQL
jgi:hypothetical protein